MYGYIYKTTNLINGKQYIGQHRATKFESNNYIGSGKLLLVAIKKYGIKNFKCELLEECNSESELNEREVYYIKFYNAVEDDNFYNVCYGGGGHTCEPWNKGKHGVQKLTDTQLNVLEYGRHLPASDKLKAILSEYRKNVVVSESTRKKLSDAQKGKKAINNGVVTKYVVQSDLDQYINSGWVYGRLKK